MMLSKSSPGSTRSISSTRALRSSRRAAQSLRLFFGVGPHVRVGFRRDHCLGLAQALAGLFELEVWLHQLGQGRMFLGERAVAGGVSHHVRVDQEPFQLAVSFDFRGK